MKIHEILTEGFRHDYHVYITNGASHKRIEVKAYDTAEAKEKASKKIETQYKGFKISKVEQMSIVVKAK